MAISSTKCNFDLLYIRLLRMNDIQGFLKWRVVVVYEIKTPQPSCKLLTCPLETYH